ncbi:MAG: transposase [Candidatus Omnitrophica bacterium]|nr:transposase [Candidatus Omnitrophota bacterium]
MEHPEEKNHRLSKDNYIGFVRVTFTLCEKNKKAIFIEPSLIQIFAEILRNCCDKYNTKNWIYVFMPDHLHFILEGISEKSNLWECVVSFKQKTGYWFSKEMKTAEWQKDFYDHIHRNDEDLIKHIKYLAENPVRQGLFDTWEKYPYTGSLNYRLEELLQSL